MKRDVFCRVVDIFFFVQMDLVSVIAELSKRDELFILNGGEDLNSGDFFQKIGEVEGVGV